MLILTLPASLERLVAGTPLSGGAAEGAAKAVGSIGMKGVATTTGAAMGKGAGLVKTGTQAAKGRIGW